MIVTFHLMYLSCFNDFLNPPIKAAIEEISNEIYT